MKKAPKKLKLSAPVPQTQQAKHGVLVPWGGAYIAPEVTK